MRLLLHSNAPWAGSGYGVQAKLFAPRLAAAGHPTAISAFYGLQGGLLEWGGTRVYPAGHQPYGTDIVVAHARHYNAEAIIALMDAWVLGAAIPDAKTYGVPLWMWAPVDQGPVPDLVTQVAKESSAFLCYSQWGTREALDAGITQARYMPLGVDTKRLAPMGKAEARAMVGLPEDAWVAGVVAANKCPYARKGWAQIIEAFAAFVKKHPDARLYLHTEATPAHGGWDIAKMVQDHGIGKHVHLVDRYLMHLGLDDDHMRAVFSSFDVLLSPSLGEGFGVPIIEAQACGVPVIIGDWTSMPELFGGAGYVIQKEDAFRWRTLQNGYWYLPQPGAIVEALEHVYAQSDNHAWPQVARALALHYDADEIVEKHWQPFLAEQQEAAEPQETTTVTTHGQGRVKISVIVPTVTGREESLERCLEGYRRTSGGAELEFIVLKDRPSCGEAWAEAAELATGDYLHLTADDIEPHHGWLDAAIKSIDRGAIPSAYLELPAGGTDGEVLPDGEEARMTPLPFMPREDWPGVAPVHYWSDYDVSDRLLAAGWEIRWCHGYRFTHHRVHDAARGRMEKRFMADAETYRAQGVPA